MNDLWLFELQDYLVKWSRTPHAWGHTDCLCFTNGGVLIKSHVDYMAQFRGHYSNYAEAIALIQELGFNEPVDYVESLFKPIRTIDAGDGDIAAVEGEDGTIAFGLFMRHKVYVQTASGSGRLARSKAFRAFEVPLWHQSSPSA